MTPEEKAVIEAAFDTYNHLGKDGTSGRFEEAMRALIYSCPQCNAGGHTCPGDGNPIGHTATDCGEHEDEKVPARMNLPASTEWVDPWAESTPSDPVGTERHTTWEEHVKDHRYPCIECLTNPNEDPRAWCDCGGRTEMGECKAPCVQRAHAVENCPNRPCQCSRTERGYCHAKNCHGGADVAEWVPAYLLYCLAGDRIRIGQEGGYTESDVLRSSSGAWHANVVSSVMPSGKTWDKVTPWDHAELRLDLSANPGFKPYPQDLPCEILMTAERRAVHLLMSTFPGSTVVDSPPVDK